MNGWRIKTIMLLDLLYDRFGSNKIYEIMAKAYEEGGMSEYRFILARWTYDYERIDEFFLNFFRRLWCRLRTLNKHAYVEDLRYFSELKVKWYVFEYCERCNKKKCAIFPDVFG